MEITKVIIPAAGINTRFLPYSKAIPAEMVPLIDKPAIHHIVDEALNSDIKQCMIITNREKNSISDYFDNNPSLEKYIHETGKESLLTNIEKLCRAVNFTYIRQQEPLGIGHAIWLARHSIGKEHFCISLPDDIIINKIPALTQLIRIARQEKANVIAVQEVSRDQFPLYGMIDIRKQISPTLFQIGGIIEKPDAKNAPSNLAIVGRYVISHKILPVLSELMNYDNQDIQLSNALSCMIQNNEKILAYKIQGTRYDISTPLGWLKATLGIALQNPSYTAHIKRFLQEHDMLFPFMPNQIKNTEPQL